MLRKGNLGVLRWGGATRWAALAAGASNLALGILGASFAVGCGAGGLPSESRWAVAQTQHIRLRADVGEQATREAAARFQNVRDVLQEHAFECALERPMARLEVTLLRPDVYDELAGKTTAGFFSSLPWGWVAGMHDHIVVSAEDGAAAERIFQHELTHRFVAACFPAVPVWLNEGVATFFENMELEGDTVKIGLPIYMMSQVAYRPMWHVVNGRRVLLVSPSRLPSVRDLVRLRPPQFYGDLGGETAPEQTTYNYAGAWALVHMLEVGEPTLKKRFDDYLALLADPSTDPVQSFEQIFDRRTLEPLFAEYAHKMDGTYEEMHAVLVERSPPTSRAMTPAEAELHQAWLWTTSGRGRRKAEAHANGALQDPKQRAGAKVLLALIADGNGDVSRARELMAEALAADPTNADVLALTLEIELNFLQKRKLPFPDGVRSMATSLAAVARSPDALRVLARAELEFGDNASALQHINSSIEAYPSRWQSRAQRADICAATGLAECALAEYRIAINLTPHSSSEVRTQLASMEQKVRQLLKMPETTAAP